jgi:hypothetical protein
MDSLVIMVLFNACVGVLLTYIFATLVVRVFALGQKALLTRVEGKTMALSAYDMLPFVGRVGYIILHGTLMTKIMIAIMLPLTLYSGLSLGHSLEGALQVVYLALSQ